MTKRRMTRRRFLAASAAGGAAAVGSSYLTFDAWGKAKKPKNEEITVTPTLCDACGNWCAMNVHTRGGRIWKGEGLPIADPPAPQKAMPCCTTCTTRTGSNRR